MSHNWSGWPGAWCLDCGIDDPWESALACDECHVESFPGDNPTVLCAVHDKYMSQEPVRDCPDPGSGRHDPYTKAAAERRELSLEGEAARLADQEDRGQ